jgi:hypothetical protein
MRELCTHSRAADDTYVPADNLPSMLEPSVIRLQHLSLPAPSDFASDAAELVPLLPRLSNLNSGGNGCRSGGMPCSDQQVGPNEGTVTDSVCLRNVDLRAKLVPITSDAKIVPGLDSLSTTSEWASVVKGSKWVSLPDFFHYSSPSSLEVFFKGIVCLGVMLLLM